MSEEKKGKLFERRSLLKLLGIGAVGGYVAPMIFGLNEAEANPYYGYYDYYDYDDRYYRRGYYRDRYRRRRRRNYHGYWRDDDHWRWRNRRRRRRGRRHWRGSRSRSRSRD